jgi:hypothetical protein
MAEVLGHDIGYTLWVRCDGCSEQMMAFGRPAARQPEIAAELRAELDGFIRAEGWHQTGGVGWLCERCAGRRPRPGAPDAEPGAAPDTGGIRGFNPSLAAPPVPVSWVVRRRRASVRLRSGRNRRGFRSVDYCGRPVESLRCEPVGSQP